jgi:putative membrane protein insertion efficiency factor
MSTLRKRLKRPETYLVLYLVLVSMIVLDSTRSPAKQLTAHLYVRVVRVYQRLGRPLLAGLVECRYTPTCSDYSIEAVQTYGIRRGLVLTFSRTNSCTAAVPKHTYDPVPH